LSDKYPAIHDSNVCASTDPSIHKLTQPVNSSEYLALEKNIAHDAIINATPIATHIRDLLMISNLLNFTLIAFIFLLNKN